MASHFKGEKMGKVKRWKHRRLKGCWTMNSLGLTQMGHKHIRSHFPKKGNTEYTQIVSSPLAFAAPKEDYRNTLLLRPLWPNRIAFGKLLLATSKMRIAWHQHTLSRGKGTLWSAYGVSMAFLILFCLTTMVDWGLTTANPNKKSLCQEDH